MKKWSLAIPILLLTSSGCGPGNNRAQMPLQLRTAPSKAQLEASHVCAPSLAPSAQIANQPGYAQVSVSIHSTSDQPPALNRDNLRIVRGAKEIPLQYFRQQPSSVGILVDISGSMDPKLQATVAAVTDFLNALNPRDEVLLFAFSSKPFLLQPLTSNHELLLTRLSLLHAYGQTALYDTIIDGILMLNHACNPRKALFVITDGMDNVSQTTKTQIVAEAQKANVPIYSIGIGDQKAQPRSPDFIGFSFADENTVDTETLKSLASDSHAKTYLVRPVEAEQQKMRADATSIARQIDNRYAAGFVASDLQQNPVRIELRNRKDVSLKIEHAPEGVAS
jgi:Ca-activated chloride channel family protein